MIMALALAKVPHPAQAQVEEAVIVPRLREDAAAAGLILVHALVNKPHRKDVLMYQPQAAQAVGILILLPALAVKVQPADQLQRLPVGLPQDRAGHPAAPVLPGITG